MRRPSCDFEVHTDRVPGVATSRWSAEWRRSVTIVMGVTGKPQENHRKTIGKWWFYGVLMGVTRPGNDCYIANWKITMLLMGKLTISMAIFNSKLLVITGGYFMENPMENPIEKMDVLGKQCIFFQVVAG